jgi:hypothetical protein
MPPRTAALVADLQRIFGTRLQSLVAYRGLDDEPDDVHTMALVERLSFQDLAACVPLVPGWRRSGCAVPLLLTRDEFVRTLDVFPIEYGRIIAAHEVLVGENPFAGMQVSEGDLRRAIELQAKSHLIHLREGFLESGGQPAAVARLIGSSVDPLRGLVGHLERLDPGAAARAGLTPELMREIASAGESTIADPSALLVRYVAAVESLWQQVDRWRS